LSFETLSAKPAGFFMPALLANGMELLGKIEYLDH